ncbi:MAG: hypothetical protein ACKOXO_08300 [Cyanobium sp.]
MALYTWNFGTAGSGLHFAVVYDSGTRQFSVNMLEGSMDLNALWFADGDSTASAAPLHSRDNALNMNGSKVAWDSFLKVSNPGLGKEGTDKASVLTAGESLQLDAPADFDPARFAVLGIRATSVQGNSSLKAVDRSPDVIAPLAGQVLIYDANNGDTGVSFSGSTAIQQAIDAAAAGSILYVGSGTFEGIVLNKQLKILGSGTTGSQATVIDPSVVNSYGSLDGLWLGVDSDGSSLQSIRFTGGTNGIQVEGGSGSNGPDQLLLSHVRVDGNGTYGVNLRNGAVGSIVVRHSDFSNNGSVGFRVPSTGTYASLAISDSRFENNGIQGFATLGGAVSQLTLTGSNFSGNGSGGASGQGDLILNTFSGHATLSHLSISGDGGGSNGLQITGPTAGSGSEPEPCKATVPIGTIQIDDVQISGSYARDVVTIGRYTDLAGLSIQDLEITAQQGVSPGWAQFSVFNAGGALSLADFGLASDGLRTNLSTNNGVDFANQPDATTGAALVGGSGVDVLTGWTLSDTLSGGAGIDVFVFGAALNGSTNVDTITDFQSGDLLALEDAVFTGLSNATLASDFGTKLLYDSGTGLLSFDSDGAGPLTATPFALLSHQPSLAATDFVIL